MVETGRHLPVPTPFDKQVNAVLSDSLLMEGISEQEDLQRLDEIVKDNFNTAQIERHTLGDTDKRRQFSLHEVVAGLAVLRGDVPSQVLGEVRDLYDAIEKGSKRDFAAALFTISNTFGHPSTWDVEIDLERQEDSGECVEGAAQWFGQFTRFARDAFDKYPELIKILAENGYNFGEIRKDFLPVAMGYLADIYRQQVFNGKIDERVELLLGHYRVLVNPTKQEEQI